MTKKVRRATTNNLVRPSRDGDQFHYLWAARRCLQLLSFDASAPKAISIEGASPRESGVRRRRSNAEEIIDVAEYYGNENLLNASHVKYIQLKHSTLHTGKVWTLAESKKTIQKFSQLYKELRTNVLSINSAMKIEFSLVSNRPIDQKLLETIDDVANGAVPRHKRTYDSLSKLTVLDELQLRQFCGMLCLKGDQPGLWDQRIILESDASHYLPGSDYESVIQLKELVTKKALSESKDNPVITKIDVLRSLKADEARLFPAPCLIKPLQNSLSREQEADFLDTIRKSSEPVIVHAEGGVGKSVFATRIASTIPAGSMCVLYDCFGNGLYRSVSKYRHRHREAFVQLANELASKGLCYPIIPSPHADAKEYMQAFLARLKQSISSLRSKSLDALLYVVIDAADNAQMASEEAGEKHAFVKDLLRESLPDGIRLIAFCRTHRREILNPPINALQLQLKPFSKAETEVHLKLTHADASEHDVDEFHYLSSQNPRVQAFALSKYPDLDGLLKSLGPKPTTVDDTFAALLEKAVSNVLDSANAIERTQIDGICKAMATLRPLIPISVISSLAHVEESLVRSFALDIGRPIVIAGDMLQFFDEPSETWFREKFKPTTSQLLDYIGEIKPLALISAYAASVLPHLLLEASEYTELVQLALSSDALPVTSPLEKRDIELQRLHFAIKACLRTSRYKDAAKLSLKAGGESAGDQRQRYLLQSNTDLAGIFLDGDRLQELALRSEFSSWNGSHHAYEASLLSAKNELNGEARSRLRMAEEWLKNWVSLPESERREYPWTNDDIRELVFAHLNIHGASRCAQELSRWRPSLLSFIVGRSLASRLIDSGRYVDLDELSRSVGKDNFLGLAIIIELRLINKFPDKAIIANCQKYVQDPKYKEAFGSRWENEEMWLEAVSAWIESAIFLNVNDHETLLSILKISLSDTPPRAISSRYGNSRTIYLRLYALQASLSKRRLELADLADEELRKKILRQNSHVTSSEVKEFNESVGALLPWYRLWADQLVGKMENNDISLDVAKVLAETANASQYAYRTENYISDEMAKIWLEIIVDLSLVGSEVHNEFSKWVISLKKPLSAIAYTHLARVSAKQSMQSQAIGFVRQASAIIKDLRENAHSMIEGYVMISRALLTLSKSESGAYFNLAAEVASKIGDENLHRWGALLDLARQAGAVGTSEPRIAFSFARCAELTRSYVERDKHFAWHATVEAMTGLCPKSALAILSRWRDRGFGNENRLLPISLGQLLRRKLIDPRLVLSLYGFKAEWDEGLVLESALESCESDSEKDVCVNYFMNYFMLEQHDQQAYKEIEVILNKHKVFNDTYVNHLEYHLNKFSISGKQDIDSLQEVKFNSKRSNSVFGGINILSSAGIHMAYENYKKTFGIPYSLSVFLKKAFTYVPVGQEAEFIKQFINVRDFGLYHYRYLLELLPQQWLEMLSVKDAISTTLLVLCQRFHSEISKNDNYEILPIMLASERSGMSEKEIVEEVLKNEGASLEYLGTERFFALVSLLSVMLSSEGALESLSYGLGLLDDLLEDSDGDGPWSEEFDTNGDLEESLSGYVWSALASPKSMTRWEASHVVRAQCLFGHNKLLNYLFQFGMGKPVTPFHDKRLSFYQLHAIQWFLLGLSRGVEDNSEVVNEYADMLIRWLEGFQHHVYIRELFKRIISQLFVSGKISIDVSKLALVRNINSTPYPEIVTDKYERESQDSVVLSQNVMLDDENEFHISYGMDRECEHLGRCFGVSAEVIEQEMSKIVRQEWGVIGCNNWEDDLRHNQQLFRNYDISYADYPSPKLDDFRSYLSYHSLMNVAGRLLEKLRTYRHPDQSKNSFQDWLGYYDLTRADSRWLFDRRDAIPLEYPNSITIGDPETWRWSLAKADFDKILIPQPGVLHLWGDWNWCAANLTESIHVRSALVSPDHAASLMRALQFADNSHDYRIPDAEDELQIDLNRFSLEGWVVDRIHDNRIDRRDPWSGDIRYPVIKPSERTISNMSLTSDTELRCWNVEHCPSVIAWSEVWGQLLAERAEYDNRNFGRRLKATGDFVRQLLLKSGKHMIIEIEISREVHRERWEQRKDEELEYLPPSARLFVIEQSGRITSL